MTELITDNVDYVTYHVSLKLRNLKDNKKVFDVLDVIILHCEKQSLTVLCDIIEVGENNFPTTSVSNENSQNY